MSEIGLRKEELDTPVLWVDLACMERNIAAIVATLSARGVGWRPHTKGIKTPAIAHKLLAAGAFGITCAKLGEAEVMAAAGIRDILVANQVVGPQKVARLAAVQRHANVKVAVDCMENVAEIGRAAAQIGVEVGVVIEVDSGMSRAGVQPGAPVLELAQQIIDTPNVRFRGVMTWEGHNVGITDPVEKEQGIRASVGMLIDSVELCRSNDVPVEIVSAGGSGTYSVTSTIPGVTEVQAGGAICCDQTYQSWGVALEPALFIQARVTSRPAADRIICDAGFKTAPRGYTPPLPVAFASQSYALSAEHGIITLPNPQATPRVGEVMDLMVGYGDATVFLHDYIYGVRNGIVETVWEVQARGKLR